MPKEKLLRRSYPVNFVLEFANYFSANQSRINKHDGIESPLELLREFDADYEVQNGTKSRRMRTIEKRVCEACGVTVDEIRSNRKYGNIPAARQIICYITYEMGYTEEVIAEAYGMKRESVHHRRTKAIDFMDTEYVYRNIVKNLSKRFGLK